MEKDRMKYQNKWIANNKKRVSVLLPIAQYTSIISRIKSKGYKSFNAYVLDLIAKDLEDDTISESMKDRRLRAEKLLREYENKM